MTMPADALIKTWIKEYLDKDPEGLDVTAHILDTIGFDDFAKYARATENKGASQEKQVHDAKQKMGMEVKRHLDAMFRDVKKLGTVPVDPTEWPELVKWCSNYSQHRVDTKSRKLF